MREEEVRQLVRDAIARQLDAPDHPESVRSAHSRPPAPERTHASHAIYVTLLNESDSCLIEPAVLCSHCGYCKTHGY